MREFIQQKAPQIGKLNVAYKGGSPPILFLKKNDQDPEESFHISTWSVDTIVEFLKEKLGA